jgi:hypothetical protein
MRNSECGMRDKDDRKRSVDGGGISPLTLNAYLIIHVLCASVAKEPPCYPTGVSGGKGSRTPDLLIANETLYQLSYTPENPVKL